MKFKKIAAVITASLIAISAVGCSNSSEGSGESDTITIGGIGPLTGENAMYGVPTMNGIKLAVSEHETVLDKKLQFIDLDDKADVTEAVNNYNKLIDNSKAVAIIGAVTSQPSASVATAAAKNNTPMITPTGTALDITTYGENIFRACYTDPFQGKVMATFAQKSLKVKTASIIYNRDSDYSVGLMEAFKETFEANGGKVLKSEGYSGTDKDFKSQLTSIASDKPEVLFVPDYYAKVALIAKQVKDVGLETVLLGADGWDSVHSIVEDPSLIEGAFFCNHFSTDDKDPVVQEFVNKYKEKYGEAPNAFAALGYDAAKIMISAMDKAGTTESSAVVEALKNTNIKSVTGEITFDEERNPIKSVSILQITNGEYVLYDKINPADL